MKTILCFGDSNTWGCKPMRSMDLIERFSRSERWPGVLQNELGDDFVVIEEGQNGRTTLWNDPIEGSKNGREYLFPCLETHQPLDLVTVMLGTNDLKARFSVTASDIASSAGVLVRLIQQYPCRVKGASTPKVLLMAPPPILEAEQMPEAFQEMFQGGAAKSRKFSQHFRRVAAELGCDFLDTAELIQVSPVDGIHYEAEDHARLGKAVAAKVRQILV